MFLNIVVFCATSSIILAQTYHMTHQTTILPGSYSQMLINPIRMFSHEFDPGALQINLKISPSKEQPFDVLLFPSANSPTYQCYINTISYDTLSQKCIELMKCQTCKLCQKKHKLSAIIQETLLEQEKGFQEKSLCCLNCTEMEIDPIVVNLNHMRTSSPVLLFDNTNYPNQIDELNLTIQVDVKLIPDKSGYHLALVLIFTFILLIAFLTTVLCVLNHKYKKAKDRQHNSNSIDDRKLLRNVN